MKDRRTSIGCSGWYYWHWNGPVYPAALPASRWFAHYQRTFDTVELNAPFYASSIRASRAKEVWAYFNNDFQGCAWRNAQALRRLLG